MTQGRVYGTALQAAAVKGKEAIVEMLLEKGAYVNAQGGLFGTALQAAAAEGDEEIVAMLLEKGADVNPQGGPLGSELQATASEGEKEKIVATPPEKEPNPKRDLRHHTRDGCDHPLSRGAWYGLVYCI
jgi:ankyrin repeat protein